MSASMRLVTVGSVALDSLETPYGRRESALGGAAVHASVAASFFTPRPGLVGVVGSDFPAAYRRLLGRRGVDLAGLAQASGQTFHWKGRYSGNMAVAETLRTDLGVFGTFDPRVPAAWLKAPFLFLANIEPGIQGRVLDQMTGPRFSLLDTMNLWIATRRAALLKVIRRVDAVVLNDQEIRQLTGEASLVKAAAACLKLGPKHVFLKRGENGASLVSGDGYFHLPAYPTARVLDPTGAGDSFAGALMGRLAALGRVGQA
ncbi:MAG: PfkB family carbohydrate kinase, partial [bacterium]